MSIIAPPARAWSDMLASAPWWVVGVAVLSLGHLGIAGFFLQRLRKRQPQEALHGDASVSRADHARVQQLAGGLINAQEEVWARIAGNLHDDVCQELAAVSMALSDLKRREGRLGDVTIQEALFGLQRRTLDVLDRVRRLSHDLHPATLRQLGLVAAVDAECVETERRHGVRVGFSASGELRAIDREIALSLFRIAQEGLRNAATHASARRIGASIVRDGDDIELTVSDDGRGFDPATVRQTATGLGLIGIEERARLLGGTVELRSRPGHGTEVTVRVPARAAADAPARDGHETAVPGAVSGGAATGA